MAGLIDIKSEEFWQVLFDEACVEGKQAERIEIELSKISVSEKEIRNKAIDEFAEKMKWEYENSIGISKREIDFAIAVVEQVAEWLKEVQNDNTD